MPIYSMQAPNGKTYEIEGPDGATEDEVRAEILRRDPTADGSTRDVPLADVGDEAVVTPTEKQSVFSRRLKEAQGVRPGLDPENEFGGPRFFENGLPNPLSTVRDAADVAARGLEYLGAAGNTGLEYLDEAAINTGLADALSFDGNRFLPGSAIGALGEAFPMGGIETGIVPKVNVRTPQGEPTPFVQNLFDERGLDTTPEVDPRAVADYQSTIQQMIDEGKTPSQIRHYVQSQGVDPSLVTGIDEAVAARAAGRPTGVSVINSEGEPGLPGPLVSEGGAGIPGPRFTPKAKTPEVEAPAPLRVDELPDEDLPENVQSIVNHVNDLTAKWENSPDTAVYDHFDGFDGVDPDSLGVYNPEDGLVYLNAKAIDREAEFRGLTQQEMTNTVMFHEGLGHFGLAQKFREDLDGTLSNWYDNSKWFKNKTDKWLEKNPDTYADDPNPLVRASEEVLAELSEGGQLPAKFLDILKNQIKTYARQVGINLEFSGREIRTILAQSHDAVINGKGADVSGNGFRSMIGRSKASSNPDRFKIMDDTFASTQKEGAGTFLNELGVFTPGEIRKMSVAEAVQNAERLGIDKEWVDYFNDRRLGVQTPQPDMSKYLPTFDIKKPMKSTYGESEGTVQGRAGREDMEGDPSVIHKVRSNRQIDDILDNADVEKTKETWGEWQSDADRIKMTTRMAEKLAAGTTPAELLAAEKHAAKLANTIFDLSHKAANQTLSPKEAALLAQHTKALDKTAQAISDVVANAARVLGSRKIEIATDETVVQRLVRNMSASEINALATPEGARKFSLQITKEKNKAAKIEKATRVLGNVLNFTRSVWSSWDLSAPFRQARALAHTPEFWKNMPNMLKYWGNKGFYDMTMDAIKQRPSYKQMQKSGLAFTELGTDLTKREEAFMSTWAEKIPGVRQSERAYNGYLNKLRADIFDSMYQKLDDAGVDFDKNPKALKDLAHFINNASGRGNLDLGKFAPTAAGVLFSPRLMASRMQMLNPLYYAKLSPGVRKQAVKSAMAFAATSVMFAKLAQSAGLDVEWDPRSSDFMKLRSGDTRYDMLGGFGQYVTLYSRLAPEFMGGNRKKNAKGDIVVLGEKFGSDDALDVVKEFVRNKFSPNMALLVNAKLGENAVGEKFDPKKEAVRSFFPLVMQDFYEAAKEESAVGVLKAAPGIVGISAQTYPGPQGSDVYGRSYDSDERETDSPTVVELKRLQEGSEETVLGPPAKTLKFNGEKHKLTDEEFNDYQLLSGNWITQAVTEEMNSPEWQAMSDEEKILVVKEITREARAAAREYLFNQEEPYETDETTIPEGETEE